jgi:O-glycosyl hydrolase
MQGAVSVAIDGSQTNQIVEGFGVNANYYSWTNSELVPALDALIDDAGITLFRVVFNNGWETVNDNDDPDVMNWAYYNALYSGPEFQKLWGMMSYLNQKGITNGLILNFQGPGPSWMGGLSLDPGYEDEWAEMVASLVIYARTNLHLQFTLLAPNNEPNITGEGIQVQNADQYVECLHKLAQLLDANGLTDIRFVAPDLSDGLTDFFDEIMSDPLVMSKMAHFGVHSYSGGGSGSQGVYDYVSQAGYPERTVWVTEYNVWCSDCEAGVQGTNDWEYALGTAQYLAGHLENDVSAALVWEGYDSYYPHHSNWSFWGLLAVNDIYTVPKTYTPRHNFYSLAQFAKFVRPGARRIGVTGGDADVSLQGFLHDASGALSLVGFNTSASTVTLLGTLASVPTPTSLDLYYSTASDNLLYAASVSVTNGQFTAIVPAESVFTLTGLDPAKTPLTVSLMVPTNGTRFAAPALIPVHAQVVGGAGTVALVEFLNGTNTIGQATNPPYSIAWSNVAAGLYTLSVRASNSAGNIAISPAIQVRVVGPFSHITVQPTNAQVLPQGAQQFVALATDSLGGPIDVQPDFAWVVNGGGTIDTNGVLTAANGLGGPFIVEASVSNVIGLARFVVATNLAREGTGYTWYTLSTPLDNVLRTAAPGLIDGDLSAEIPLLPGGGVEQTLNMYEAGGVIWMGPRMISRVVWHNGGFSALGDGVFGAEFGLQFTWDALTWSNAGPGWTLSPSYPYDSAAAANREFEFSGDPVSVQGVRCIGLVHTSDTSGSWSASVREVEAFAAATLPTPVPSLRIDCSTNSIILFWDGWAGDYVLESCPTPGSLPVWAAMTNTPEPFGRDWRMTLPVGSGPQFFRLRSQ